MRIFGRKESVKENHQGFPSRSITRRSDALRSNALHQKEKPHQYGVVSFCERLPKRSKIEGKLPKSIPVQSDGKHLKQSAYQCLICLKLKSQRMGGERRTQLAFQRNQTISQCKIDISVCISTNIIDAKRAIHGTIYFFDFADFADVEVVKQSKGITAFIVLVFV